jgi:acetoacetyl-CoA reductase
MTQKVAVVSGGTRGIGEAISVGLHKAGYKVAAIYQKDHESAENFKTKTGIDVFQWDVSCFESCAQGIDQVESSLGPINVLVNNAGITRDTMFHKMTPHQWQDVMMTNLNSCFNMTRCVIEGMRERNYGRIISISSINAQKGQIGQANYSAAKAGILGFTKTLAQESASKGITVNAIAPGYIETDMVAAMPLDVLERIRGQIPLGRLGTPEEVAQATVYLASPEASFITGSTLSLNGGQFFS